MNLPDQRANERNYQTGVCARLALCGAVMLVNKRKK